MLYKSNAFFTTIDPLKNEESADDLTTTSQQFTESEDLSHPKKLYRVRNHFLFQSRLFTDSNLKCNFLIFHQSRKILCFGLLGFFVFVLFVVVISLVLLMRYDVVS
jgi:hypothetical protein